MSIQSSSVRTRSIAGAECSGILVPLRSDRLSGRSSAPRTEPAPMIALLLVALIPAHPVEGDLQARIRELHGRGDRDACAALLSGKPEAALPAVEGWLDSALALRESGRA